MSAIEWTDATWNPVRGCSRVSKGCEHCYAEGQAHRFSGAGQPYEGLTVLGKKGPRWAGEVRTVLEMLEKPLRWRKPRMVFVNSMSDLFHESVPFEFIAAVLGVAAACPQHTFQILTKRDPRPFFEWLLSLPVDPRSACADMLEEVESDAWKHPGVQALYGCPPVAWPLPNVWLGVSVEDQATADERIPWLLECPAAVRWVSYEPALGGVDFDCWLADRYQARACLARYGRWGTCVDCPRVDGTVHPERCELTDRYDHQLSADQVHPRIDWIVVGGESGPGARPFDLTWARSTIAQCRAAGVPVFVKQLGANVREPAGLHPTHRWVAKLKSHKGNDPTEWPGDLRVREWPADAAPKPTVEPTAAEESA